jgi:hypothetical protein
VSLRQYVLPLDGTVQRLSDVLAFPDLSSRENVALRLLSLQPGPSNLNEIFVGDVNVTTALWTWRLPVPTASVPPAPLILGGFEIGPATLADFYVLGTYGETLHIGIIPF